jgi:hypothetical protein
MEHFLLNVLAAIVAGVMVAVIVNVYYIPFSPSVNSPATSATPEAERQRHPRSKPRTCGSKINAAAHCASYAAKTISIPAAAGKSTKNVTAGALTETYFF